MKTTTKTVDEILKTEDSPLPLTVIPNNMGINLCSVEALTWTRQDDGQLVSLTIHFIPTPNHTLNLRQKRNVYCGLLDGCCTVLLHYRVRPTRSSPKSAGD